MIGKARYDPRTRVFTNLSPGAIEALWESFNDVADGFGIHLCEMQMICQDLASELDIGQPLLDKQVQTLFTKLDSDENALVDAIEFLSSLAVASGMSTRDKLEFVFTCFDFDGAGHLSVDEINLAFRCTLMGLCKLTGEVCPCEEALEVFAMRAFAFASMELVNSGKQQGKPAFPAKLRILVVVQCRKATTGTLIHHDYSGHYCVLPL